MKPDIFAAQLKFSNRDEQVFFLGQQKMHMLYTFWGLSHVLFYIFAHK